MQNSATDSAIFKHSILRHRVSNLSMTCTILCSKQWLQQCSPCSFFQLYLNESCSLTCLSTELVAAGCNSKDSLRGDFSFCRFVRDVV